MSQDDSLFLNKVQEGIRKNSHGLIIRIKSHLKERLLTAKVCKEHYIKFMNVAFGNGNAEEIHDKVKKKRNGIYLIVEYHSKKLQGNFV